MVAVVVLAHAEIEFRLLAAIQTFIFIRGHMMISCRTSGVSLDDAQTQDETDKPKDGGKAAAD